MRWEGRKRREEGSSRGSVENNVQRSTPNAQRSSCGRGGAGRWLSLLLLVALPVRAGEILGGRFKTVPDALYVNQAFEIHFELEVTFGSEVEDVRITDFPNNPELITVGRLETAAGSRVTRGTQTFTVHRFIAKARGHQPIDRVFQPHVHCMLVERRNAGFFSDLTVLDTT